MNASDHRADEMDAPANGSSRKQLQPLHRSPFRSLLSNWIGFFISACIAFFISPFVVKHLGNSAYGVWVLIGSLTGYLGLLDLGVRSAVTRYVSRFHALEDHREASRVASSALMIFVGAGVLAILVSVVLAVFAVDAFRLPSTHQEAARVMLTIAGVNIAVSLISGVFGGILVALQRFDVTNLVEVVSGILRAAAIVVVLLRGHGLIALAVVQLLFAVANCVIYAGTSIREYPQLRVNFRNCDLQHLRIIFSFSVYAFLITISMKLVFYTDSIVIGAFLPVSMITFFAIAGNLLNYSRDLISGISTIAAPKASGMDAEGDIEGVRRVLLKGAQFGTMVILPIALTFILRGKTFIRLWMGAQYAEQSGHVLWILTLASIFIAGEAATGSTMVGIGKHKPIATVYLGEAFCNLGLSVALIHSMGIYGVAWGTTLPSLAKTFLFWPWYVWRVLRIPMWKYVSANWLRPAIGIAPFAVLTYYTERTSSAGHLTTFFLQVAAVLPAAGIGYWYLCFGRSDRDMYLQRFGLPVLKFLKYN
jgi:O-antigen/teichoic acid export membrane protein